MLVSGRQINSRPTKLARIKPIRRNSGKPSSSNSSRTVLVSARQINSRPIRLVNNVRSNSRRIRRSSGKPSSSHSSRTALASDRPTSSKLIKTAASSQSRPRIALVSSRSNNSELTVHRMPRLTNVLRISLRPNPTANRQRRRKTAKSSGRKTKNRPSNRRLVRSATL